MPFSSLSQRRKFYALKSQGKMDQKTIDEWEKDTPADLPEKVASSARRRAWNIFVDAQNQILQEDPEYRKIRKKLMKKEAFWIGFEKKAGAISKAIHAIGHNPDIAHGAEVAGLGILAAPGIHELYKGEGNKKKNIAETAGLGVLAIPSLGHFASKLLRH